MDGIARAGSSWAFHTPLAELRSAGLTGRVDVAHPELGLHEITVNGQSLNGRLLCIGSDDANLESDMSHAWPIAEAYVRGSDLVASYEPKEDWPYSPQVYWQAITMQSVDAQLAALSLSISVQTHLLDTWPRINVQSQVLADEVLHLATDAGEQVFAASLNRGSHTFGPTANASCVVHRLPGDQISYAEIMPASDFQQFNVRYDDGGNCATRWQLFADFLEKGVIWRARLLSVLLPCANDVELASACCRTFGERPLPLTT